MFSKRLVIAFLVIFLFLSFVALINNMPQKKSKRVYNEIVKYFPYEIKKEFGGLDIVDKRSGKDLDIQNSKVFLAYDEMLKKWGKKHLILEGDILKILDDNKKILKKIKLNKNEVSWVKKFFEI